MDLFKQKNQKIAQIFKILEIIEFSLEVRYFFITFNPLKLFGP